MCNNHLNLIFSKANFPEEAVMELTRIHNIVCQSAELESLMDDLNTHNYQKFDELNDKIKQLAEKYNIHEYSLIFVFFLYASEKLLQTYRENNIPEEYYWDFMDDFRCKLLECKEVFDIWGTSSSSWHAPFYHLNRFALGRLQYENSVFRGKEPYVKNGIIINPGDPVYNIHIPSSGPLTFEKRLDTYKKAFNFYEKTDYIIIVCNSWLIFPKHYEFLPLNSNIIGFMNDFDILWGSEEETFGNSWRVFGRHHNNPPEKLPTDTGLRRVYADWLMKGNKTGSGYGVLVFDGEKRIN